MTAAGPTIALPWFLRRTLGLRSRRRVPFDAAVRLRWGDSALLLNHPDDVRHVLVDNAGGYVKTRRLTSPEGRRRAGRGLLTSSGDEHRRQRALLQPLFHRRAIERFTSVMVDRVERMLEGWRDGGTLDIADAMAVLTRSVIIGTLFGLDYRDEGQQLARAIQARRRYTDYVYHSRLPLRTHLPMPIVGAHRRALGVLDDAIAREIARRRHDGAAPDDLLSLLMAVTYPDGSAMTDQQVRDEVLTFTSTGYETLGEALAWTWYLLASHAAVEARVADEVRGAGLVDAADLQVSAPLKFTEAVLRESLRLYPPTWVFERVALGPDRLPSGTPVEAGGRLYLCQWVMHRHPRFFPAPDVFDPARFLAASARPFRFVYFPFGDGAHTCIGEQFAMLEALVVVAAVSRRFRVELVPGPPVVPRARITLSPKNGIRVRTWRR